MFLYERRKRRVLAYRSATAAFWEKYEKRVTVGSETERDGVTETENGRQKHRHERENEREKE